VVRNIARRNSLSHATTGEEDDKKSFEAWNGPMRMVTFDEK
jgi:hypothetical protein